MRAKLDSGASLTVIPVTLVREWNLVAQGNVRVRAYDDTPRLHPVYYIDLRIGTRRFDSVRVIASSRRNILLGRNVLNQLSITRCEASEAIHAKLFGFIICGKLAAEKHISEPLRLLRIFQGAKCQFKELPMMFGK